MDDETFSVPEMLRHAARTYEERNKVYGDTYKIHGYVINALFPAGIRLSGPMDHNRFAALTLIISKLTRYCQNFDKGGHADSLHDLAVYAMMLQELDNDKNNL